MSGVYWTLVNRDNPSEWKRAFRFVFGIFRPFEFPEGSGRIRGAGFNLWINTPWVCLSVGWNNEEQEHDYLRDGVLIFWGRRKAWSINGGNFYNHRITCFSRLKLNPICTYQGGDALKLRQINREMAH